MPQDQRSGTVGDELTGIPTVHPPPQSTPSSRMLVLPAGEMIGEVKAWSEIDASISILS